MRCVVGVLGCFRLCGIRYKAESTDERFKIVNLLFCLVLLCENVFFCSLTNCGNTGIGD